MPINYNINPNDPEFWVICEALGADIFKHSQMKKQEDGSYEVEFKVGGVELDFSKVARQLIVNVNKLATKKAIDILHSRCDNLVSAIDAIEQSIDTHKDAILKFCSEEE